MGATKRDLLRLYAKVLRRQSALPFDMQALGHTYIRHEFREHFDKCGEGSGKLSSFLLAWTEYLDFASNPENMQVKDANVDQRKRLTLLEKTIKG
jgi:hypothetical protein